MPFKKIFSRKNCPKCKANMKPVSYLPIRGWRCSGCKGILAKIEYIVLNKDFFEDLDEAIRKKVHTGYSCSLCNKAMSSIIFKKSKKCFEFCQKDNLLFFDLGEDTYVGKKYKIKDSSINYNNPRGIEYAIHVKYAGQIHNSANYLLALKKAKDNPEELKKVIQGINEDNSHWD